MKNQNQDVNIVIRTLPSGEEFDVSLPLTVTGNEIINAMLDASLNPRFDNSGNQHTYSLINLRSGVTIRENETLKERGVKEGDILIISPVLIAGGFSGNMMYFLPQKFKVGQKSECNVRIAKKGLTELMLSQGFKSDRINEIEINNLMIVKLEENSTNNHFYIKALNSEEQIISDSYFSEWNFEITPQKIGFTSIILKIIMPDIVEGFGERYKDVFLLNKDVEITTTSEKDNGSDFIEEFKNVYEWTARLKEEIYGNIAQNETGEALTKLINFFQNHDLELLNAMIIFQAQWNEGRNKSLLNIISQNEWLVIQTKINYGILEMLRNIENKNLRKVDNLPIIKRISNQIKGIL